MKQLFKGELEHRLTTLVGSSRKTPRESYQRQTARVSLERNDLRLHTYKNRGGGEEGEGRGEKKRRHTFSFRVRPLAGIPYKFHVSSID